MSPLCPYGHQSATTDYCDQCGAPLEASAHPSPSDPANSEDEVGSVATRTASGRTPAGAVTPDQQQDPCPGCGAPRSNEDRFCEECGHDMAIAPGQGGAPGSASASWELVVSADRAHFEQMEAEGVDFPADYPPRKFVLDRARIRLGRMRPSEAEAPEIDLSAPPQDPAISYLQALLVRQDDGSFALIDPGSTNGVTLNDDPKPIAPNVAVPLADGDRLRVGAWTKITVRASDDPPAEPDPPQPAS